MNQTTSTPTTSLPAPGCPGCSATTFRMEVRAETFFGRQDGIRIPNVVKCNGCGGVYSLQPIPVAQAVKIAGIARPMSAADSDTYFDLVIQHADGTLQRVHGWMNDATGEVTQFG